MALKAIVFLLLLLLLSLGSIQVLGVDADTPEAEDELKQVKARPKQQPDAKIMKQQYLTKAVSMNKPQEVYNVIVKGGADANYMRPNSTLSLLSYALSKEYYEVAEVLIQNGADVNLVNDHGVTPIMLLDHENKIEALKFLLKSGADVNIMNKEKWSVLHIMAKRGATQAVEAFLNYTNENGGFKPINSKTSGESSIIHKYIYVYVNNVFMIAGHVFQYVFCCSSFLPSLLKML